MLQRRTNRTRLARRACLFALLLGLLAGCSSSAAPRHDGLRLPLYGRNVSLDPALAASPPAIFLSSLLFSGLVKFGPDLHVIPDLAVSIPTISDGGRTYTFTVRQDARFADGHRCTAADIAYSLWRALSPGLHSAVARRYLGNIVGAPEVEDGEANSLAGVQVLHRLALRIQLLHPDVDFLDKLAFPVGDVVDRRVLPPSPAGPWLTRPAGTGPWTLKTRNRDGSLLLSPRSHFYGGHLTLRSLLLVPVSSPEAALTLYRKGQLDAAQLPSSQQMASSTRPDFHSGPALAAYYAVAESQSIAPLAAALNRDSLIQSSPAQLSTLLGIVPPAVPDYVSSPPTVDPLALATPAVSLRVSSRDPVLSGLRRALARQWPLTSGGGLPVRLVYASNLLPDPAVWLALVPHQTASYRGTLHRAGRLTNDPVTRMNLYSRDENWALSHGLIIPLASASVAYLIKPRVDGLQVTPLGLMANNDNWSTVTITS